MADGYIKNNHKPGESKINEMQWS